MKHSSFHLLPLLPALFVRAQDQNVEPCTAVSSVFNKDSSSNITAELAFQCLQSVPLVVDDAVDLLDGWAAFLEWQSDPTWKADPPSETYLFPGFDYMQAIADLKDRVTSGNITREFDLHEGIRDIIHSSNDGHMFFRTDFNSVFFWQRAIGLVSVSPDGHSLPEIFASSDISLFLAGGLTYTPSPIISIDGQEPAEFLSSDYTKANILQDPDALYNNQFYTVAQSANKRGGGFYSPIRYPGPSTTLAFANGSEFTYPNVAGSNRDWAEVVDGPTLYWKFCNVTRKAAAAETVGSGSGGGRHRKRDLPTSDLVERQSSTLKPVVAADDGSFAAYILFGTEELQRTGVIALHEFTFKNQTQVQSLTGQFLASCREQGVDHLVLDISSNGGGLIMLAYDMMRQLFPEIYPYFARQLRAHPQLEVLGEYITNVSIAVLKQTEGNRSATIPRFGSGVADATSYVDRNGQHFPDWPAFFGPVLSHDDSMTRLFTWDVADAVVASFRSSDPDFDVTRFGYNAQALPRTFEPENIVILSNGDCSSSCTTLSHLLKWQAKVKTVVMGGRPQTGPMQHPGGVKGGTVVDMSTLVADAKLAYNSGILPESLAEKANDTNLVSLVAHSNNLMYRTSDPSNSELLTVNLVNSVLGNEAKNGNPDLWADKDIVPLQMLYEAADCRLFYTAQTVFSRFNQWTAAANQAFGFNGTEAWSGCVEGSFGHETSLSGDELLYNGGVPVNVTGFDLPTVGGGPVDVSQFDIKGNQFIKLVEDGQTPPFTTENGQATETGRPMETPSENDGVRVELGCGVMAAVAVVVGLIVVTV